MARRKKKDAVFGTCPGSWRDMAQKAHVHVHVLVKKMTGATTCAYISCSRDDMIGPIFSDVHTDEWC